MAKFMCKVKVLITETSEIIENIEVEAPDEVTAEDDAITIANVMSENPEPWLDSPREKTIDNIFEFEVLNINEI